MSDFIDDVILAEQIRRRLARQETPIDFDAFALANDFDVQEYLDR